MKLTERLKVGMTGNLFVPGWDRCHVKIKTIEEDYIECEFMWIGATASPNDIFVISLSAFIFRIDVNSPVK